MAEPSYSRDELFAEDSVPSRGGWERIAPEFVRSFCLGQNDTVVDLMEHIPYITREEVSYGNTWMVYERACPVHFTGDLVLSLPTRYALESLFEPEEGRLGNIPPHVCAYATHSSGHCDGHFIFINTERGVVMLADWQVAVRRMDVDFRGPGSSEAQIYREEGVFMERSDRERCMNRLDEYDEGKERKEKEARGEKELPSTPPPPPEDIFTIQARMREKRSDIKFIDEKSLGTWRDYDEMPSYLTADNW
ncbi:hypothetical protein C8034_v012046 [Colletotrichum sidae]|uniref:Uncharacterized protein n=1 Tax=Colletotrichum sidae TaxID=1347389 RepID=A0A4R8TI49_9PEZI|nr:hypothetical protein C8034_v012046 [Colletotrichum sidae]